MLQNLRVESFVAKGSAEYNSHEHLTARLSDAERQLAGKEADVRRLALELEAVKVSLTLLPQAQVCVGLCFDFRAKSPVENRHTG